MKAITRLSAAICIALAAPVYADGMVENVNGITLDKDGKVVRFSAALIDREGKVSQLLTSKERLPNSSISGMTGAG